MRSINYVGYRKVRAEGSNEEVRGGWDYRDGWVWGGNMVLIMVLSKGKGRHAPPQHDLLDPLMS